MMRSIVLSGVLLATAGVSAVQPGHTGTLSDDEVHEAIDWARILEQDPLPYALRPYRSERRNPVLGGVLTPRLRIAAWVRNRLVSAPDLEITPPQVPSPLRMPIVVVQFAQLGLSAHAPEEARERFPCGHEQTFRLLAREDIADLGLQPAVRPLWFEAQPRRDEGTTGRTRCLVTAAFTRADLERHALLHVEVRYTGEDRVSFGSSIIVHVGPEESRAWR